MQRMTAAELLESARKRKGVKRVKNARRTTIGDMTFDSELEARWWMALSLRVKAGAIHDLQRQVKIPLLGSGGPILTPTGRQMYYVADFAWVDDGRQQYGDAKGHPTEVYQIKRSILAAQGITLREFR